MPLKEGQWQLGDTIFGRFTKLPIENVEVGAYSHQVGDIQMAQTDEIRFGRDFFQPGNLTFTMSVLNNRLLESMAQYTPPGVEELISAQPVLEGLITEWRADDIRKMFGYTKVLKYCKFGVQKRVYGRPRKISTQIFNTSNEYVPVVAEYQRVDTMSYSDEEFSAVGAPNAFGVTPIPVERSGGGSNTWARFLITGPITNPIIQVGSLYTIELEYALAAGKVIEITAYPWERRIIDSDGFNLAPKLTNLYMEQIILPPNTTTMVGLSGSGTTVDTALAVLWREAYNTL